MGIMSESMEPLKNYPGAEELFLSFGTNPLFGLLVAALFTALIQGSAATIGIVLSLSVQGLIPLQSAIPLILGANIGTCATAMLSTIGASTEAKRVGVAHVLFKILGVVLIFPFIGPFTNLVSMTSVSITRQIANAHTLFNVGITVAFLPFSAHFARVVERLVPTRTGPKVLERPEFLDRGAITSPILAIEQARAEVLRVARMVEQMVDHVGQMLNTRDEKLIGQTTELEIGVDALYKEIIVFLSDISEHDLSEDQSKNNLFLIQTINDLEHIGDVVIRMTTIISEKVYEGMAFSPDGRKELVDFHRHIATLMRLLVQVLEKQEVEDIAYLLKKARECVIEENNLRVSHIRRLQARIDVSRDSSSVHLDLINCMRRIAEHIDLVGRNAATGLGQIDEDRVLPGASVVSLIQEIHDEQGQRSTT